MSDEDDDIDGDDDEGDVLQRTKPMLAHGKHMLSSSLGTRIWKRGMGLGGPPFPGHNILTEASDPIITEGSNNLVTET